MYQAIFEILDRIRRLPEEDRFVLEEQLALLGKADWQKKAAEARRLAREKGLDQPAIDRAVDAARHSG